MAGVRERTRMGIATTDLIPPKNETIPSKRGGRDDNRSRLSK